MKKRILCFLVVISLPSYGLICSGAEKRLWINGKWYATKEYERLQEEYKKLKSEKVRTTAEEFIIALLMKDEEKISELSYYKGFKSDKKWKASSLIDSYHGSKLTVSGVEIIFVKIEDIKTEEATVGVKVNFTTIDDKGTLSAAPVIHKWKFICKHEKWFFLF